MAPTGDETDSNRACTQFVHSTVSILPSLLERLVFLAHLREPDTGQYSDRTIDALLALRLGKTGTGPARRLDQVIGLRCARPALDRALSREHLAVFEEWLCLKMRQQMAELERYASSEDIPPHTLFRQWIDEGSHKELIPSGAMAVQRDLFLTDMEIVLATLLLRTLGGWGP